MSGMEEFTAELKDEARRLGFTLAGVCAATMPPHYQDLLAWLEKGWCGTMRYLPDRREAYRHPSSVLEGCRTIMMLGLPYDPDTAACSRGSVAGKGRVARYARSGIDYHDVVHRRLKQLRQMVLRTYPDARVRGVVDTAPLLERDFAQAAGLGWIGKNTMLINKWQGSYFFLAALLTDLELRVDEPHAANHCGRCRACLDACPTGAFPAPYQLDARRCISYLTIEHRGRIAEDLQAQLDGWVFGCDVCQEVCPWNRKAIAGDPELTVQFRELDLLEILSLDEEEFRRKFRPTAMWRTRRAGMIRNAILLLVTEQVFDAVPALQRLLSDPDPQIRQMAAWGIARLRPSGWQALLATAIRDEHDPAMRRELEQIVSAGLAHATKRL